METHLKKYGQLAVSLSGVIAVWWIVSGFGLVNQNLFPTPPQVLAAAVELYRDGVLISDLQISLKRAAIGFTIGSTLGGLIGLLTDQAFRWLSRRAFPWRTQA